MRLLSAIFALVPLFAFAQSGEWGSRGVARRFLAQGSRVFAADGRGVAVYDVSQSTVKRTAVAETSGESLDLALLGDRDLVVATRAGIDRFSVGADGSLALVRNYPDLVATMLASNGRDLATVSPEGIRIWKPDLITIPQFIPFMQPVSALAWHDDTLIIGVAGVALYLLDPTGSRDTELLSENARDVAVVGDILYIAAGGNGIVTYDLGTDPPRLISRADASEHIYVRIAVGSSQVFAAELPDTISIFDVVAGVPVIATRFKEPVRAIAASGTRLFVSGTVFDQFGLPIETGIPLRVFEGANAVSEFRDLAGPLSGVATDGSVAYVVDRPYFRVIDVSTTTAPRELASLFIEDIGDRVRIRGTQAVIYGRGKVHLIDFTSPYAPRLVKIFDASGGPPSNAAFARNTIVEANQYSGFHVIDFVNFTQPGQIGGIKGHYFDLAADGGDVAYTNVGGSSLATIDLADVHDPRVLNTATIGPAQIEIAPESDHHPALLVVQTLSGIRIYSLGDPRNPMQMSFNPSPTVNVIAVDRDVAYLASPGSVQSMNVTDPAHPAFAPIGVRAFSPMQVATAKDKLVIADRYSLRIFGPDTAPPPAPPPTRRRSAGH